MFSVVARGLLGAVERVFWVVCRVVNGWLIGGY